MNVAAVRKRVEIERCWIWVVIFWSLYISVCSPCIASGTAAWSWNATERKRCHAVYINLPSGHVKVTGPTKLLTGGGCTTWTQYFGQQGRCKATGVPWPGRQQAPLALQLSSGPYIHSVCHMEEISLLHTAVLYRINVQRGKLLRHNVKNLSCRPSEHVTVPTCREREST